MQGGDISNRVSPAIVIDVDNLIIMETKKLLGLLTDLELTNDATKVLNALFSLDLSVYLVYHRAREVDAKKIRWILETNYLPYTRDYWMRDLVKLDEVINLPNVTRYFRHTSYPERVTLRSSAKAVMIDNLMEVSNHI